MSISEINRHIRFSNFTNDELSSIIEAVKFAKVRLGKLTKASLALGDNVSFVSSKTGQTMTGFVTKIAIKYVTVKTLGGLWRVPANMLTVVEDEADNFLEDFNSVGSRHHY